MQCKFFCKPPVESQILSRRPWFAQLFHPLRPVGVQIWTTRISYKRCEPINPLTHSALAAPVWVSDRLTNAFPTSLHSIHQPSYTSTPLSPKTAVLRPSSAVRLSHQLAYFRGTQFSSVAFPHPVGTDQHRFITQHLRGHREKHWKRICLLGTVSGG